MARRQRTAGITAEALQGYIEEQIDTLPGVRRPREEFSVVLTGSRATGEWSARSDVDIDVLCRREVFEAVRRAALAKGLIRSAGETFFLLPREGWQRYFGRRASRPHFSLIPIEEVRRRLREYDDVSLWIWTQAKIFRDPGARLGRIVKPFRGYPRDLLVRKIQYRWMLAAYWMIDVYPHHHAGEDDLLPAATSLANAVNELYRVFFLVEGRPFPYPEKLSRYVSSTKLGRRFKPHLARIVKLAVGVGRENTWSRLDEAFRLLAESDANVECRRLEKACAKAMIAAGVSPAWVKADYANIQQLFSGELGPMP